MNYLYVFTVDSSQWYYNAFEEEDGSINLVLEIGSLAGKHADAIEDAITKFVINELGEELLIAEISNIDFFESFDEDLNSTKSPVKELKAQILPE